MGATYDPQYPVPFDELKSTDEIDAVITRYRQGTTDTSHELARVDGEIRETNDQIASINERINTQGYNLGNIYTLRKEKNRLNKLTQERKELEKELDGYNYSLQNLDNEIIKNMHY